MKHIKTFEKFYLSYDEFKEMENYIIDIMDIIDNIDFEIKCTYYTLTGIVNRIEKYKTNIYVYNEDCYGVKATQLYNISDEAMSKLYNYLKDNYDHVLTGKDMGLL